MMSSVTTCVRWRFSALDLKAWLSGILISAVVTLNACSSTGSVKSFPANGVDAPSLSTHLPWTLLSLENTSDTHTASETVNSLLETYLRRQGIDQIDSVAATSGYAVQGEISRWHYSGVASSVPAVTLRLDVHDLSNNTLVWPEVASGEGRRRESLTGFADRLIETLVKRMPLNDALLPPAQEMMALISNNSVDGGYVHTLTSPLGLRTRLQDVAIEPVQKNNQLVDRSIVFYYADNPPTNILSQFDRLVFEPDNISAAQVGQLTADGASAFAYLSIGEVGPERAYSSEIHADWILGKNPVWNSQVFDLTHAKLQAILINRVGEIHSRGYQGIFLDTMDSYNIFAESAESKAAQQAGLVNIIERIGIKYPKLRIITNRGFEVIDLIAHQVEAVAAESLYSSWDNIGQRYKPVSNNDRQWLLSKLDHVKNTLGVDVIAIDYLPPANRGEARVVAKKMRSMAIFRG